MSKPHDDSQLADLLSAALDGKLTSEQQRSLQKVLSTDPASRRRYVDLMLLDTMLAEELSAATIGDAVDLLTNRDMANGLNDVSKRQVIPKWAGYVAAAVLLVASAIGLSAFGTREVSAAALIAQSRRAHHYTIDQCYVVKVNRLTEQDRNGQFSTLRRNVIANLLVNRIDRLWTRGDRFFIESSNGDHRWVWGQDESGMAWLALNRHTGLQLEADEMPGWLSTICDLLSMRVDTLLGDVLRDFELSWEDSPDSSVRIVRATAKQASNPRWVQEAILEIDVESKILKRVIVKRGNAIHPVATVTYTLTAAESQPDESYSLVGHLEPPFNIFSRSNRPERRDDILTRLYGPDPSDSEASAKKE